MTIAEVHSLLRSRLTAALDSPEEGAAAARAVLEDVAGWNKTFLFINSEREVLPQTWEKLDAITRKIEAGDPVQYATGKAYFAGKLFSVNPSVLIPRFETEWLVDTIVKDYHGISDLNILDIGTGSGCIAISLATALPFPNVTAIDVSEEALKVAQHNAHTCGAKVNFVRLDILTAPMPDKPIYDIIVSNPPYVLNSEAESMDVRVKGKEPALALFVDDNDPLIFYRHIANYARKALKPNGKLYLEINQQFPKEMRQLLDNAGFINIEIIYDYRQNIRYATARQTS